jgi:hypothetical protein
VKDSEDLGKFDDGLADLLGYNPVWYWMMIFIVLGIVILTLFFLLKLKDKENEGKTKPRVINQNVQFAGEIDKAFLLVANKAISTQEACQRVSIILREYLHNKTGLPANSMTVTDLVKAQAPPKVVENIKYLYPIIFGDKQIGTYDEFVQFMNSSRAVIDGKWS